MINDGPPGCLGLAHPSGWANDNLFLEAVTLYKDHQARCRDSNHPAHGQP